MSRGGVDLVKSVPCGSSGNYPLPIQTLIHSHVTKPATWKYGRDARGQFTSIECLACGNIVWLRPEDLTTTIVDVTCGGCGLRGVFELKGWGQDQTPAPKPIELPEWNLTHRPEKKRWEKSKAPKIKPTRRSPRTKPAGSPGAKKRRSSSSGTQKPAF